MGEEQDIRDQLNRLWEDRLHEDNVFNERQNFFLVSQSMLLVAYATLLSASQPNIPVARITASLGVLLTLVWIYVNARLYYIVRHIQDRAISMIPEYKETIRTRTKWPISSTRLMAYFVPLIIGAVWAILIFVT